MLADEEGMRQAHAWLEHDRNRWQHLAWQLWALLRAQTALTDDDIRLRVGLLPPPQCGTGTTNDTTDEEDKQ